MRKKQTLLIVIISLIVLIIAGAVFAYLFLKTDMFKSNQELFAKYSTQAIEQFQKITEFSTLDEYENVKNENQYESNTSVKFTSSEGGEISNPLNKLSAKINIQKDEDYLYGDGQILFDDEEYLQAEILKEKDNYGIRFSDVVKQFITIKNDDKIEDVAKDLEIDVSNLEEILKVIDNEKVIISEEEAKEYSSKYNEIIKNALQKGTFTKQKNAMITYNNFTTQTNAYTVILNGEQVREMLLGLLNQLKEEDLFEKEFWEEISFIDKEDIIEKIDELIDDVEESQEVSEIKITVYEQKQNTIRTIIELGDYKITIDNINEEEIIKMLINIIDSSESMDAEYNILMTKTNNDEEEFYIEIQPTELEEDNNYEISATIVGKNSDNLLEVKLSANYKEGIQVSSIEIENTIEINADFDKKQVTGTKEEMVLNDLDKEKRQYIIKYLKEKIPETMGERYNLLINKVTGNQDNNIEGDDEESEPISTVEINRFNSKFEFYTGEEISTENVKKLLEIVKDNIKKQEITVNGESDKAKSDIILYIEKDQTDEEGMTKVLETIKDNKKYKVSIKYNDESGIIENINITEL